MKKIPKYVIENSLTESPRKWKSSKRKQAREARRAIDELRQGCAYFPNGNTDVGKATEAVDRIIADISVKNWGS
ncbi:hypothetical protein [Zhongshania sp.]|uniref:hypothetical protein n=1 Tax=Zhongshania sp. TaxID=1971902 RepID=UPI003565C69F